MARSSKSKTSKRHRLSRRRRRVLTKKSRRNGGGCGCGLNNVSSASRPFFTGGNLSQGPTPGLGELAGKYHYPLNTYNFDPNYGGIASRQTENIVMKGGKRRRGSRKTGGANITGALISGLSSATQNSVVGANSYMKTNYFSAPFERYTAANPPLA